MQKIDVNNDSGGDKMKINVGSTDRILRLLIGIGIISLGIVYQSWLGVIGIIPIVTAFVRWCPIYSMFSLNTCPNKCEIKDRRCETLSKASEF